MVDHFRCSICGKEHGGLPTDWGFSLPDDVWDIAEPTRSEVARFNNDLCEYGDRRFIRCVLETPFSDDDGYFGWGAWVEVDIPVYDRYFVLYDEDGSAEPPHPGILANSLPPYPDSKGKPVLMQFRDSTERPSLSTLPDDHSTLALEQRNGIDQRRFHEVSGSLTR